MLAEFIESVNVEIEYYNAIKKRLVNRKRYLQKYEDYKLVASKQRGRIRYYMYKSCLGRSEKQYLNEKLTETRKEIQEKYYVDRALERCERNLETLYGIKSCMSSLDPKDVTENAALAYREQDNAMLLLNLSSDNRWKQRKLDYKNRFPTYMLERLRHIAIDGTPTRSKSEALIIELLNLKGVPYVYECPIKLGGQMKSPDFIIYDRKLNREIILEHMGRMDNHDYQLDQYEKIGLYIENGYVPNVNLLLTFDDKDGNINIPAISRAIDAILRR